MINFTLFILPGSGASTASVPAGTSIARYLDINPAIRGRQLVLNGSAVEQAAYAHTILNQGDELAATAAVKGA